jgi:hypothetical protein
VQYHDVTGSGGRYEVLQEVLERQQAQQEQDEEWEAGRLVSSSGRRAPLWLLPLLVAIAAWLWLVPPTVLRVDAAPVQPIEEEEAALRFVMHAQALRIEEFRQQTGRFPSSLEEAGPPLPGLYYARLQDDLYQLTGSTDRLTLTYRSDLPLDDFAPPAGRAGDGREP